MVHWVRGCMPKYCSTAQILVFLLLLSTVDALEQFICVKQWNRRRRWKESNGKERKRRSKVTVSIRFIHSTANGLVSHKCTCLWCTSSMHSGFQQSRVCVLNTVRATRCEGKIYYDYNAIRFVIIEFSFYWNVQLLNCMAFVLEKYLKRTLMQSSCLKWIPCKIIAFGYANISFNFWFSEIFK